jgi:competence protein ComEA
MSSAASPSSQPIPGDRPPRLRWVVPWTWPAGARGLLAGLAVIAALGLNFASRDVRSSSKLIAIAPKLVLDPNTAKPEALAGLPNFGPVLVNRLVQARTERPFSSLDDVRDRVRGVGPVTLARIAPHLRRFSLENLASTNGVQPVGKPRTSRRKSIRNPKPASTPLEPRLAARDLEPDTQ